MNVLLDTHTALWWVDDDDRLDRAARRAIKRAGTVWVSAASAWEVAIKMAVGKLKLRSPFELGIDASGFGKLPITFTHAAAVGTLPFHHGDPFDRLIIAQAQTEGLVVVTHDRQFEPYGVPVLWA